MGAKPRKFSKNLKGNVLLKFFKKGNYCSKKDVVNIRKWMKAECFLTSIVDDKTIETFLKNNKGNIEAAKADINLYHVALLDKQFLASDSGFGLDENRSSDAITCIPLPKQTKKANMVSVFKIRQPLEGHHQNDIRRIKFEALHLKPELALNETFIVDLDEIKINRQWLKCLKPTIVLTIAAIFNEVMRARVEAIYIVNASPLLNTILRLLKKTYSPQLIQKIQFCKKKELKNIFPRAILPVDYGGTERSLSELNDMFKIQRYKCPGRVQNTLNRI